jgi:hypothetical protein
MPKMTDELERGNQAELPMVAKAGPFYQEKNLVEQSGKTQQELRNSVARRDLLAVQDDEGDFYYPDRQFMDDGSVVPGLREVLNTLHSGTPVEWIWALWLSSSISGLDGRSAWDALRSGDLDAVLQFAERDAARWAE